MNDYTAASLGKAYAISAYDSFRRDHGSAERSIKEAFDAGIAHERESRKPRTITTASELRALPVKSVVITQADGGSWQKSFVEDDRWWSAEDMAGAPVTVMSSKELAHRHGPLTLLVPASESAPEPVRLTAAEAAGLRPGSWVRGESNDGSAVVGVIRQREVAVSFDGMIRWFDPAKFDRLYLLAEAPDPDAEKVAALVNYGLTETAARGHLAILREAGLRVDQ